MSRGALGSTGYERKSWPELLAGPQSSREPRPCDVEVVARLDPLRLRVGERDLGVVEVEGACSQPTVSGSRVAWLIA